MQDGDEKKNEVEAQQRGYNAGEQQDEDQGETDEKIAIIGKVGKQRRGKQAVCVELLWGATS